MIGLKTAKKQRLDKFLTNQFPRYSRAFLKEQIKQGNFLVNNKKVKPHYILSEKDKVGLAPNFSLPSAAKLIPNYNINPTIIYEDSDILVINKPAGLSVHPRQDKNGLPLLQELDKTLVSGLLARYPEIVSVGDNPLLRPGIVHRLDKDTSGIMIVAKNQKSFLWLKKQFKDRLTIKKYLALVNGHLKKKGGEIKCYLKRSQNPTKQKVSKEGREAISQYKVIKEFKDYSLVEIIPKTGRFHQIRVQFAWLGHPVAGDTKYGSSRLLIGSKRHFLHAKELSLSLPNGQIKTFSSPLPTDLKSILEKLS
jgi:23S rRNA pseudouridine1911/1915/1917 synthase